MPARRALRPARRRSARLRHLLHLGPTGRRRSPVAGPLTLLAVGGVASVALATGVPSGLSPAAAAPTPLPSPEAIDAAVANLPDVSAALQVLAERRSLATTRSSRSKVRHALTRGAPAHRWVLPYAGTFTSPYGFRWGRLHAGIDLAGPTGSTIVAATDGCISYAGPMGGYGEVMQISDWDGTETVYGHMSSYIRTSGCVKAGQPIARVGSTGDATGPHLHFEVRVNGVPVNPVPFLARRGVSV
jgi:murein DD-endopeptidase MepM/ murein hydrolase activator NlpD